MAEIFSPRFILALDTALSGCSVSVLDVSRGTVTQNQKDMMRGQAEHLVPMVQDCIADAGIRFQDIDLIATTIGPGAFTGLRIGMSTARSFALALSVPLVGFTTLEVLAQKFFEQQSLEDGQKLCVLIETKRKDFYWQSFDRDGCPVSEPMAEKAEDIIAALEGQSVVVIGDALQRFQTISIPDNFSFQDGYEFPETAIMAHKAATLDITSMAPPEPLYLRGADVSVSKRKQRVIEETL